MRVLFIHIFLLYIFPPADAQECKCHYNHYDSALLKPRRVFLFKNNKTIGLYGDQYIEGKDTSYSEFSLCLCDKNEIIFDMIDDGTVSYIIKKIRDTLLIEEMDGLPIGKNFSYVSIPFYFQKFFFHKDTLRDIGYYRNDIKKYSKLQVKQVLQLYKNITRANSDYTIAVANRLFWACVSGSKDAEILFNKIPVKFKGFDGAYAEDMDDITDTYNRWKKRTNKK